MHVQKRPIWTAALAGMIISVSTACHAELPLDQIRLPEGFTIEVYAEDVPNARSMVLSESGVLFVGTRLAGNVYALVDTDGDGRADTRHVLATRLHMPNGVALRDGALYVAEVGRLLRFDAIEEQLENPPNPVVVYDDYPKHNHHGWKYIAFGPDGYLYVPVGAPCNRCESEEIFASITRMRPDGSEREIYAHGVRNSVGFDWHPETGVLWFTDNGADGLGDDVPPDELNVAPEPGMHFGYPYIHGRDFRDPRFGVDKDPADYTAPALELGPHVAALGMKFYTGAMFPEKYRSGIFIAEHGSWDRSAKIGYRVQFVPLEDGKPAGYETFAEGWLQGQEHWGRPVDVVQMPDGSLLVSDDYAHVIYRISYTGG
jgi:glucose/arabinose dehydrogenase